MNWNLVKKGLGFLERGFTPRQIPPSGLPFLPFPGRIY